MKNRLRQRIICDMFKSYWRIKTGKPIKYYLYNFLNTNLNDVSLRVSPINEPNNKMMTKMSKKYITYAELLSLVCNKFLIQSLMVFPNKFMNFRKIGILTQKCVLSKLSLLFVLLTYKAVGRLSTVNK